MTEQPRIWFDATTVRKLRDHSPVGLSRVEANVLKGAFRLPASRVRFCNFNRYGGSIEETDAATLERLILDYGGSANRKPSSSSNHGASVKSQRWSRRFGKAIERSLRTVSRRTLAKSRQAFRVGGAVPLWRPGDFFVLSGSSWDSVDSEVLTSMATVHGLRLLIVIADMVPVLFPHHFQDIKAIENFTRFAECSARHAELVLSISESTKRDFDRFAIERKIDPIASEIIYLGSDLATLATSRPDGIPVSLESRDFLLSVSTIQVRKNHQLLYQIWRRFAEEGRRDVPRLVLVGSSGWLTDDLRHQIANDPLVQDSITILNQVDDAQLAWLYQNCRLTLYPSHYEGWGLPIIESLQYGKLCLASNTSSMPEAGQGLAIHLDPLDFRQWYEQILRWSSDDRLLLAAEARIRNQFVHRSWQEFGDELCQRALVLASSDMFARVA
jgi:glycosyltransferase involved in cell wall biosynthesis